MTDKQIIVTFQDGYCLVLEDNEVSIRENDFTKYRIVVGNRTNELLNFVKELYLAHKRKEQECSKYKKALIKVRNIAIKSVGCDNSSRLRGMIASMGVRIDEVLNDR